MHIKINSRRTYINVKDFLKNNFDLSSINYPSDLSFNLLNNYILSLLGIKNKNFKAFTFKGRRTKLLTILILRRSKLKTDCNFFNHFDSQKIVFFTYLRAKNIYFF